MHHAHSLTHSLRDPTVKKTLGNVHYTQLTFEAWEHAFTWNKQQSIKFPKLGLKKWPKLYHHKRKV